MANIAKEEREIQMYSLVEKWQNLSSSKKEFCLENNVNIGTFNYWLKKHKNNKSVEFIEPIEAPEVEEIENSVEINQEISTEVEFEVTGKNGEQKSLDM